MKRVSPLKLLLNTLVGAACAAAASTQAAIPAPPSFASNYQQVWAQDFSTMTSLSQLNAVGGYSLGTGTWISHTPKHQDWFTFIDPGTNNNPFGVGSGYLTIRVAQRGYGDPNNWFGGYSGGLLCSMDSTGAGFSQKYGYFECSMQTPGGPNTWPSFWLLDATNLTTGSVPFAEIDVTESYGNYNSGPNQTPPGNPNWTHAGWINWGANGTINSSGGHWDQIAGLSTGFHTYGVDIEPTTLTYYVDRVQVYQTTTFAAAQNPMYVLVNLALGGASYNNANGTAYNWALTPNPSDLKVKYVAVWASPNSPNYVVGTPPTAPAGLTATPAHAQVTLNWTASSGATGYNIYRGTGPGAESTTPIISGVTTTAYANTGLTDGTTYYYKVKATNSYGTSGYSSEASATPSTPSATLIYDDFSAANNLNVYGTKMWDGGSGGTALLPNNGTTSGHVVLGANLPGGAWSAGGGSGFDYDAVEIGNTPGAGASTFTLTGSTTKIPYARLHNNENVAISLGNYHLNAVLTTSVNVSPQSNDCYVGFDSALNAANNFSGLRVDQTGGVALFINGAQSGTTIAFTGTWDKNVGRLLTFKVNTTTGAISGVTLQGSSSTYAFTTTGFTGSATAFSALFTPTSSGLGYALFANYQITN